MNLDYLKCVAYNDIKKNKLARLLYLLVETDEEKIKKIYEGDELLMDVKKEAERIMENFDALLYYDPYELGKEVGMDKGIDIGKNEGLVLVAKYNVPISVDTIRRRYPIKWTYQEGVESLIVDTKIWVF